MKFLKHFFTWWHDRTIGTAFFTWRRGELVGHDSSGNRYYREKRGPRRWVIYNGEIEASRVPPEWHGWLHHTDDRIPEEGAERAHEWEADHVPNLTGTGREYHPPGSLLSAGRRNRATGDYEAWKPE